jgi:hypothetical protein
MIKLGPPEAMLRRPFLVGVGSFSEAGLLALAAALFGLLRRFLGGLLRDFLYRFLGHGKTSLKVKAKSSRRHPMPAKIGLPKV